MPVLPAMATVDTTSSRKACVEQPFVPATGITLNQALPKELLQTLPDTHLHPRGPSWKQQRKNQAQSPSSSLSLWWFPLQQISVSEMQ